MKYFVSKLVDGLEYLLGLGGMKRDIAFLIISGAALLLSLFDAPLPFSAAWVAIILCGVPIVTEAFIGIITKFDIKADLLVSLALISKNSPLPKLVPASKSSCISHRRKLG